MKYQSFTGKTVDDAINKAIIELGVTSSQLDFIVIDKGAAGILGIGSRPAVIEARAKQTIVDAAEEFLSSVFETMKMEVFMVSEYNDEEKALNIDLQGDDMGILIAGYRKLPRTPRGKPGKPGPQLRRKGEEVSPGDEPRADESV